MEKILKYNDNLKLTEHFKLSEFLKNNYGVSLSPSMSQIYNLFRLSQLVEMLRTQYGPIHINSGLRNAYLNSLVNGATSSQHLLGLAADIKFLDLNYTPLFVYNDIQFDNRFNIIDQCLLYDNFLHISIYPLGSVPRHQFIDMR